MLRLPLEGSKQTEKRKQIFTACWEVLEKEIHVNHFMLVSHPKYAISISLCCLQKIISSQHDKVFDELLQFITQSHKKLQNLHPTANRASHIRAELSTAVLVAGVNMPDHVALFQDLVEKLCQQTSPYVVLLRARDCNSGSCR